MLRFGLSLECTRPGMLILAALGLAVVWYYRRSLVDFARWQRRASLAVRLVVLMLLVLAAAGLNLVRQDGRKYVVFLVDRSDSVDEQAARKAEEFVAQAGRCKRWRDEVRVMEFGGNALAPRNVDQNRQDLAELDRTGTDIAGALATGWASIPAFYAKELVVLSDGRATRGDAVGVAEAAHRAGVRVSAVPLASSQVDEVQVARVVGPAQVRMGATFDLQIEIASNHEDEARIEVFRNDISAAVQTVAVKKGITRLTLRQTATQEKLQAYTVRLTAGKDRFVDNNTASALIACDGKPRMLLVESTPRDARYLGWALEKEDIVVDVRVPRGVPRTLADLENFDLLCLSNVPATDLSREQMQLIRSYVQDLGGGLIMIGGDKSFGLGGYYKSVLEEILPVRSDFEKEKEKPSLAMVLVIDKSGSMGGEKIELAKEAAKSAVELLGPRDQVGVIAFDGEPTWVCPLHSASDKPYVLERISSLAAGGGTCLAPALSDAYSALAEASAKLKHVIALTDGISQPGSFYEIVRSMADSKITVSTVAVGQDADKDLLQRIAEWGAGRSYFTDSPLQIPQIFAKETMEASKSAINEQPFSPRQIKQHAICDGIDWDASPLLLGYVIARAKPTAELLLVSETGDPILATWRYGLGKSLAFTSDAKNRWAAEWLQWEGFAKLWAQAVRDTMRTASPALMDVRMTREGERVQVTVDAMDPAPQRAGQYIEDVQTVVELLGSGADKQEIPLEQVSAGRWAGQFDTASQGSYHARIVQKRGDVEVQSLRRGLAVGYSDEYRVGETDEAALRRMCEVGGGMYDPKPEDVFAAGGQSVRVQPLSRAMLMAALILLVVDVALRRVDLSALAERRYDRRERRDRREDIGTTTTATTTTTTPTAVTTTTTTTRVTAEGA